MRRFFLYLFLFAALAASAMTEKVTSPDGQLEFTLTQTAEGALYYTVTKGGRCVVAPSALGVDIKNELHESALGVPNEHISQWCANLRYTGTDRSSVDSLWTPAYGEWNSIRDHYNAMTVRFQKGNDEAAKDGYSKAKCYFLNIDVRAYNEGVAFRYSFPEASNGLFIHLTGEQTEFAFEPGARALCAKWAQDGYVWKTLDDENFGEVERPLTMKLANGLCLSLLEGRLVDYARTKFAWKKENVLQASVYSSVDFMSPFATSWRAIMVGETMTDLANNDFFILNLNEPCRLTDTSWIRPGKAFRTELSKKQIHESIDFAAEHHMQYVLLDARWYGPEMLMSSSALAVDAKKDFDIPEIVGYGAEKGVGIWLYVNQRALYQELDSLLPLYEKWGVKGIKFGFVQVGNQHWTTWLHNAVRRCAEHHLLVDIHDEYRPTGWQRTYPNLLTVEGVGGNEEMPTATHNVTLPFTRFLCGPADYTLCYFTGRKQTTYAHQLAMAAVYYSPFEMLFWYDRPAFYKGEQEIAFWERIPTVWDDTKVLQGDPGEYVVTARRSGSDWFVGAMTGNDGREVTLPLTFLEKGKKYMAHLYEDDPTLTTRTKVRTTQRKVTQKTTLTLPLQPSGGAAIWFEQIK